MLTNLFFFKKLSTKELQKRAVAGTLSEIVGKGALPNDRLMRTFGFSRFLQNEEDMEPSTLRLLQKFSQGINYYIDHSLSVPFEFEVLGISPSHFSVQDLLQSSFLLALELSMNLDYELQRYKLLRSGVSVDRIMQLIPGYPSDFFFPFFPIKSNGSPQF